MPASRKHQVPQARAMYAQGLSMEAIADALHINSATLYRWRVADREAGADWEALRDTRRRKDPRALIAVLEDRLEQVAADKALEAGAWADVVQKISNVLHRERERLGDISTALTVLTDFATFAHDHGSDEDLAVLLRLTDAYLSDLKRSLT